MVKPKHEIRQRNKQKKITMDVYLPLRKALPEGSPKDYKMSAITEGINLTITAMPDDWRNLYDIAIADPEGLGKLLLLNAFKPVYEKKIHQIDYQSPRGIHATIPGEEIEKYFMHDARKYVAATFTFVSYWIKKPKKEWPIEFNNLIRYLKEKNIIDKDTKIKKLRAIDIALYLFEDIFGNRRRMLGLMKMTNEMNFRNTYLKKDYLKAARRLFKLRDNKITIDELYEMLF